MTMTPEQAGWFSGVFERLVQNIDRVLLGKSHVIRLALSAYDGGGEKAVVPAALADTLFAEPVIYRGQPRSAGLIGIRGGPTLAPAWAMPLDQKSWLLRLHEITGQRGEAKLELAPGWTARRCGLDGSTEEEASPTANITFRPYEIVSVRIEHSGAAFG